MNTTADIFYVVASIYLLLNVLFMLFLFVLVLKVISSMKRAKNQLEQRISKINIARFSLQAFFLKNVLTFLEHSLRGGDTS